MGIPVIRGREFTDADTARSQAIIVIDQALAERHFPGENPLGRHLRVGDSGPNVREVEIVGVAGDVKHFNLDDPPTPTYYSPIAQVPQPALGFLINGISVVVRTAVDPLSLSDQLRHQVRSLDPNVPASGIQTMDQMLGASIAPRRFNLRLIEVFAAAALALAAMGTVFGDRVHGRGTTARNRHSDGVRGQPSLRIC
jgi:hypothetical protein